MLEPVQSILRFVVGEVFDTRCYFCDRRTNVSVLCNACCFFSECKDSVSLPGIAKVSSSFWLEEKALDLIHQTKYKSEEKYFRVFKKFCRIPFPVETPPVLIPVPSSFARYQMRGFNQAWLLCRWVHENQGTPYFLQGLLKEKETLAQSTLTKSRRLKNLKNAFYWNLKFPAPEKVILVDDIYTTGATLTECAKVLKKNGVREIAAWTLFRTPCLKA